MERIIKFRPAYDKRHTDPKRNYGIHGVELLFLLKGEEGAVQFVLYTNWHLPHVQKELELKSSHIHCHPMPADLGFHSPKPMYEGQTSLTEDCEYLDGKPCFYDGSTMNAERVFNVLLEKGDEGVWSELESYYKSVFNEVEKE
jgi:hypothetical protein